MDKTMAKCYQKMPMWKPLGVSYTLLGLF